MSVRDRIVEEAYTWIGTPYHVGACLKDIGVDCAQLIAGVGVACDVLHRDQVDAVPFYHIGTAAHTKTGILARELSRCGFQRKRVVQVVPGDILTFRTGMDDGHIGIVVQPDRLVHACWRRAIYRVILQRGSLATAHRCYAYPGVD